MRKRTINHIGISMFWTTIYLLPLLAYLMFGFHQTPMNLSEFLLSSNIGVITNNVIYEAIKSIFGGNGILPLFHNDSGIMLYFSYYINVVIFRLITIVLLFIPKLAIKWSSSYLGGEDNEV